MNKTGIELIAEERERQIRVKGYTKEKDATYVNGELAIASIAYINAEFHRKNINDIVFWPTGWSFNHYKPSPDNRIKELQKAGALIAAEIDRIQKK